jgi:ATP-dependent exoDNAse (exonuclease V) alpha subunit
MICSLKRVLYPKTLPAQYDGGYAVALYTPHEKVLDTKGFVMREIKVVGCCLPLAEGLRFRLHGRWGKDPKYGPQFELASYENLIAPGKEGLIAYLSSDLLKGIGRKTAERIYNRFGDETLHILDTQPESLLKIPGISPAKLSRNGRQFFDLPGSIFWHEKTPTQYGQGFSSLRSDTTQRIKNAIWCFAFDRNSAWIPFVSQMLSASWTNN